MRILLILIALCLAVPCMAEVSALTGNNGVIYNATSSSSTSTEVTTPARVRKISYDNKSGFQIYVSTFQIHKIANHISTPTVNTSLYMYPIQSSTDATKSLTVFENTAFRFITSSAGTPSASGVWALIEKD